MSCVNDVQRVRSVNWDAAPGSFKPSTKHKVVQRTVREGCITRRNGKIIREVQTVRIMNGDEIVQEVQTIC